MRDRGDGVIITGSNMPYGNCNMAFVIYNGAVTDGMIIKPMLTTNLSATYDDFVPYTGDGETLAHDVAHLNKSLEVLDKCKNLLNPTLQTTTINGVTCTNNGDGTYTLNGTATNYTNFILINEGTAVIRQMIDGKTFKVTGFKETGNYRLECTAWLPTGGTYVFDSRIWNVPNGAKGLRIDIAVLSVNIIKYI